MMPFGSDELAYFATQCRYPNGKAPDTRDLLLALIEQRDTAELLTSARQGDRFLIRRVRPARRAARGDHHHDIHVTDIALSPLYSALWSVHGLAIQRLGGAVGYWQVHNGRVWTVLVGKDAQVPEALFPELADQVLSAAPGSSLTTHPRRDPLIRTDTAAPTVLTGDGGTANLTQWCPHPGRRRQAFTSLELWTHLGLVGHGEICSGTACRRLKRLP